MASKEEDVFQDAGDQDENEVFEDALDMSSPRIEDAQAVSVETAAEEATRALDLLLNNQFGEALRRMRPRAHESMYHALGQSTIMFMQAVLTIDMSDIKAAQEAIRQGVEVCNRFRRRTSTVARMLLRPDYTTYTIEEVHAELCYAECLLENAILTFIEDQSLVTFIKGGLKIRSCYQSYKECMQMLATRNWESSREKGHFESGVHLGVGAFNLLISQLPTRILKLLEFIGFSGNKTVGLRELEEGCMLQDYLRGPLCSVVLVAYHTFVLYILGLGDGDLELSDKLVKGLLSKFPQGVLSLFFNARMYQVKGQIDNAVTQYYEAIQAQNEWIPFHYICYWELLWCHNFKCDWDKAIETANILREGCRWSKATYVYIQAACMYAKLVEGSTELLEDIANLLRQVPALKQKIAGKSIPIEKFVVKKSQKFFDNGQRLTLPAVEIMYMWNSFPMIGRNEKLLLRILCLIENAVPEVTKRKEEDERFIDDYCLAMLLKGVCKRYMGHPLQAEECFLEVFKYQNQILEDTYLLPFAAAELGFLAVQQQQYTKAKEWLDQARTNYHDYLLESLVHFRIHSALKSLRSNGHLSSRSNPTTPSPTNSPFPSPLNTPTHAVKVNGFPYLSTSPGITKKVIHPPISTAEGGIVGAD
ncbi:tetratricopeptide repeat protein 39B-like isoform X2 [Ornithodoros turicata]|uniref:tetratricopeptide repeat protein 39B-like isoform X2 n=1 Tax=Ornithodoros turicata TaxID=34597 RepID=UPI0031398B42